MRHYNGIIAGLTAGIIAIGAAALGVSTTQAKNNIEKHMNQDELNLTDAAIEIGEMQDEANEPAATKDIVETTASEMPHSDIVIFDRILADTDESLKDMCKDFFLVYRGIYVNAYDAVDEKETAKDRVRDVIDILVDKVRPELLEPLGIALEEYDISIQRQLYSLDDMVYGVTLSVDERIKVSIVVDAEDGTVLGFTRDGLVGLMDGHEMPDEYLVENWAKDNSERLARYNEYYDKARDIIVNRLGLPDIYQVEVDPSSESFVLLDDSWSNVSFGYQLENGLFIRLIFNRVNGEWNGFVYYGYSELNQ